MVDGYLMGPRLRRDVDKLRGMFLGQADEMAPRHRRAIDEANTTTTGGGGSSGGSCGCCDCLDCVDLCDAPSEDVIDGCTDCPNGATKRYTINVGAWDAYPDLGGEITVTHDAACVWKSAEITTGGATYQWVLTQSLGDSSLELQHVAGTDPLRITAGYWQVKWSGTKPDGKWSCRCPMILEADNPEQTAEPTGLNCTVCVVPYLPDQSNPSVCPPLESTGKVPCVTHVDIGALSFPLLANPAEFPFGWSGTASASLDVDPTIEPLIWDGVRYICVYTGNVAIDADGGFVIKVSYPNIVHVTFYAKNPLGTNISTTAVYQFPTFSSVVIGSNTCTLISASITDPTWVTWPATLSVTLTDCTFGAEHVDYGYGCGGTTGGDCGGQGCVYTAIDSNGIQGGPTGPWTWSSCSGCPDGCTMPAAPGTPSSGSDTYTVSCQPV